MKEYIEREAVMQEFADYVKRSNNSDFAPTPTWNQAVQIVEDAPVADVVEVVRCRDCKYKEQNAGRYHVKLPFYCALHDEKFCDEMEFCSYGAKMDKETE